MSLAGRLSTEKNLKTPIAKKITGKIIFAATEKFLFQVRIIEIKIIAAQDRIKILICGEKNSANKIPAIKNKVSMFKNAFEIFIFIIHTEKFFKIITKKIITDKNFAQKKSRPLSRNKFLFSV